MKKYNSHNIVVNDQFSSKANSYLSSTVHASGKDLELMTQFIGSQPDAIALDVGCGAGHAAFHMAPLVKKVVAYDLSEQMLNVVEQEAKKRGLNNIVTKQGEAENYPCPDQSFDIAVTRYSAHHWQNLAAGLAQMRRVLKPMGTALFMDVITPDDALLDTWLQSLELLRDPSHVRNASLSEWCNLLTQAGFNVTTCHKFRLRLDFKTWVERMKTPDVHIQAIRSLQAYASTAVRDYFEIEEDGSFIIDSMLIAAEPRH